MAARICRIFMIHDRLYTGNRRPKPESQSHDLHGSMMTKYLRLIISTFKDQVRELKPRYFVRTNTEKSRFRFESSSYPSLNSFNCTHTYTSGLRSLSYLLPQNIS